MTDTDILQRVKTALGISSEYQDETIKIFIQDVRNYMLDAGVPENIINSDAAIGAFVRGVADLWNYGSGSAELSQYFKERVIQMASTANDPSPAPAVDYLKKENTDLTLKGSVLTLTEDGQAFGKGIVLPKAPVVNMIDIQSNIVVEEQGIVFGGNISIVFPNLNTIGIGILAGHLNSDGLLEPSELYTLLPPFAGEKLAFAADVKIAFSCVHEDFKFVFDESMFQQLVSVDTTAEFINGIYTTHIADEEKRLYLFCGIKSDNGEFLNEVGTYFSEYLKAGKQMCVSFIPFDDGGASNE